MSCYHRVVALGDGTRRRLLLLSLLALPGGCFDLGLPQGALRCSESQEPACPRGMVCLQGRCYAEGTSLDLGTGDFGTGEGRGDQLPSPDGAQRSLSCASPTVVGSGTPAAGLYEVALRSDGLTLVARTTGGEAYEASRPQADKPFGSWTKSTLLADGRDPTFFSHGGTEHAVVARGSSPRHLELCTNLGSSSPTCSPLALKSKSSGLTLAGDMDGPSVAVLASGPLLVCNVGVTYDTADVFLARPSNLKDLAAAWIAEPLPVLSQPGVWEDDPALSDDGLLVIVNAGDEDLSVSERPDLASPFTTPRPLVELNTTASDGSPDLAPLPPLDGKARYELFLASERGDGRRRIYRTVCTR